MESLEMAGWVRAEDRKKLMRGVTAWRANPLVHSRFAERAEAERRRRAKERAKIAEAVQARRGQAGGIG